MSSESGRPAIGRRRFLQIALARTGGVALLSVLGCAPAAAPTPAPTTAPAAKPPAAPTAAPAAQAPKPTVAPTTAPAAAATQPAAAPTTAPAAAARLSELAVGIDSDPTSLDSRLATPTQAYPLIQHFNEPLTFREPSGKVMPWLAESWERDGDLVWKFKLRKNVRFTNGEPWDAEAAKYSLDCVVTPDTFPKTTAQKRSWLAMIDKVDIVDAGTIAVKTKYPSRTMLTQLSVFGMLPPKAGRELGERYGTKPVGTGPYKVVEYVPGNRLVLEPNKEHWGGAPAQDKLTFRFLPEAATRVAALEAGEVAMINNVPPDQIDRIKGSAKLDVVEVMGARFLHLYLMGNRPPFNDIRVRKAINHALDKEGIVKALLGSHAQAATSLAMSTAILYAKPQPPYEFDFNKAKQLVADAGVAGAKIKYGYVSGRFLNDKQVGQAIGQQLEKLGLSVAAETGEWAGLFQKMTDGYFDAWFTGYSSMTLDPDRFLNWPYNSKTSWTKYNNPKVDELLLKGDQSFKDADAEAVYQQLQSILWQDAANGWLYFQAEIHGVSKKLRNQKPRPDEWFLFKDVYLEK